MTIPNVLKKILIGSSVMLSFFLWFDAAEGQANNAPTIDTITTSLTSLGSDVSSISPSENTTVTVYVHGTASDLDGCEEIDAVSQWTEVMHRTNVASAEACSADNNDCYAGTVTLSGCSGGADQDIVYEYSIALQYYADPTDAGAPHSGTNWTSYIKVEDDASASDEGTDTWEYNSLLALNITENVDYGTLTLGAQSAEKSLLFTNTGNRDMDASQSADNMSCTAGIINTTSTHYSATSGFTYGDGTEFTNDASTVQLNLLQRTNDASESTKTLYTLLKAPDKGAGGTCTHTIVFTAIADS